MAAGTDTLSRPCRRVARLQEACVGVAQFFGSGGCGGLAVVAAVAVEAADPSDDWQVLVDNLLRRCYDDATHVFMSSVCFGTSAWEILQEVVVMMMVIMREGI